MKNQIHILSSASEDHELGSEEHLCLVCMTTYQHVLLFDRHKQLVKIKDQDQDIVNFVYSDNQSRFFETFPDDFPDNKIGALQHGPILLSDEEAAMFDVDKACRGYGYVEVDYSGDLTWIWSPKYYHARIRSFSINISQVEKWMTS